MLQPTNDTPFPSVTRHSQYSVKTWRSNISPCLYRVQLSTNNIVLPPQAGNSQHTLRHARSFKRGIVIVIVINRSSTSWLETAMNYKSKSACMKRRFLAVVVVSRKGWRGNMKGGGGGLGRGCLVTKHKPCALFVIKYERNSPARASQVLLGFFKPS